MSEGRTIEDLRAVSLMQPWASLVAWKHKRNETRKQKFTQLDGRWFVVHASSTWKLAQRELLDTDPFKAALADCGITAGNATQDTLPRGAYVAVAYCLGIVPAEDIVNHLTDKERAFGDYAPGRWIYGLAGNVYQLHRPIQATGRLGVWTLDDDMKRRVLVGIQGYRDLPPELRVA